MEHAIGEKIEAEIRQSCSNLVISGCDLLLAQGKRIYRSRMMTSWHKGLPDPDGLCRIGVPNSYIINIEHSPFEYFVADIVMARISDHNLFAVNQPSRPH